MPLIRQLVKGRPSKAAIARKKKKIQAVINSNKTIKSAIDELVGAARPKNEKALLNARVKAIAAIMRTNLTFAKAVDEAANS
jgi:aspartate oxidase